jgi:hypothetical protein
VALIRKQQRVRVESLGPEVERTVRAIEVSVFAPASIAPSTVQNLILVVGRGRLVVVWVGTWGREEIVLAIAQLTHVSHRIVGIKLVVTSAEVRQVLDVAATLASAIPLAPSRPVLLWIVIATEEAADVSAHVEERRVLVVERGALVGDAVVHRMVAEYLP